jgi:hypothetical protein
MLKDIKQPLTIALKMYDPLQAWIYQTGQPDEITLVE